MIGFTKTSEILAAPRQEPGKVSGCAYCGSPGRTNDPYCCSACRLLDTVNLKEFLLGSSPTEENLFFDRPENVEKYLHCRPDKPSFYRLSIFGLDCFTCVHLLEELPVYLESVVEARVNFSSSKLLVSVRETHSLSRILQVISSMGYEAKPIEKGEAENEADRIREERLQLARIAVAGACAANTMMLTVAVYAGANQSFSRIFHLISLILFLPVLLFSARGILKSAWGALQMRSMNIDLPLATAFVVGFAASVFNLIRGRSDVYFDSSASFLFLILISRWLLRKSQSTWDSRINLNSLFGNESYQVIRGGLEVSIPKQDIQEGDTIQLSDNQVCPVDGRLRSDCATFDCAWVDGEALPRILQRDSLVSAGCRVVGPGCLIEALGTVAESDLSKCLSRIQSESYLTTDRANQFDRTARVLLISVFFLGILVLSFGSSFGLDLEDAFSRALSLLIVACPCALAFGGPLAYGAAIANASKEGILIKNADVLDRILECERVVFDKTGTLTTGRLILSGQTPNELPNWMKDLILELERTSSHPVAFAFRELWPNRLSERIEVTDVNEVAGSRVFGLFQNRIYSVQSSSEDCGSISVALVHCTEKADVEIARFDFSDELRPESRELLRELSPSFDLAILSGDRSSRVRQIADSLAIGFQSVRGDCKPAEKAMLITSGPKSIMLGDGINDAEALSTAHVGIAVRGPLGCSLKLGSVYFLRPGLNSLRDLLRIARRARRLTRRNLALALVYNVTAGAAAICGYIHPLSAAVLMPISSLVILLSTWEGSR